MTVHTKKLNGNTVKWFFVSVDTPLEKEKPLYNFYLTSYKMIHDSLKGILPIYDDEAPENN